jgi:hypothetical protein
MPAPARPVVPAREFLEEASASAGFERFDQVKMRRDEALLALADVEVE